jgi:hypothetical protein
MNPKKHLSFGSLRHFISQHIRQSGSCPLTHSKRKGTRKMPTVTTMQTRSCHYPMQRGYTEVVY